VPNSGEKEVYGDDSDDRQSTMSTVGETTTPSGGKMSEEAKENLDTARDAIEEAGKKNEDVYTGGGPTGGFEQGGLVAKPANKKLNKKRKTQRRKGLGTRP